jgi:peptidoglycan/xylan/chitin deacetylase (PgdA/CDA1 family)
MRGTIALLAGLAVLSSVGVRSQAPVVPSPGVQREIAITMDDLPGVSAETQAIGHFQDLTASILDAFARHAVPAIGFVNQGKLDRAGEPDPDRLALLRRWADAGLELGNHTYSHIDLHTETLEKVEADVVRGEPAPRALMTAAGKRLRYFRHPFLHTGRDAETRRSFEAFLAARGYRVAPVTVDNSDYVFASAYDHRVGAGDTAQAARVLDAYIGYMNRVVTYYEVQSVAIVGRPMRQILLIHANALNARALPRWLPMLEARGYRFITLDRALEDPAFAALPDEYYGAGGITWLHRWALTAGKRGAFFAGEPEVPAWVQQASMRVP